jgi:hypothetical protein
VTAEETRARFLAAIAAQIPADRVIELHLFGAIKQGGTESGVAVIAVDPEAPVVVELADEAAGEQVLRVAQDDSQHADEETDADDASDDAAADDEEAGGSPYASSDDLVGDEEQSGDTAPADEPPAPRAAPRRYIVYTARYRLTLKGPDRGKWEASVTEEADAPLITVDAVVRGVSRRSGDADETVRLSGDEFRAALPVVAARP